LEKLTRNQNASSLILLRKTNLYFSCEIIRDKVSGDSLQYAFIEFAEQKSCEDAYFKMDNVLIDDRRIHVDFSQSVSKLKWKGKGNLHAANTKLQQLKLDSFYNLQVEAWNT
jgi:RNA recognition motif-containing protein